MITVHFLDMFNTTFITINLLNIPTSYALTHKWEGKYYIKSQQVAEKTPTSNFLLKRRPSNS